MKFLYFGSSTFSKIVLENIFSHGLSPSLVITKPDAPKGRGLKIYSTEVSNFAKKQNLNLLKPKNLKTKETLEKILHIKADYLIVADYGNLIPSVLLSAPKKMPLGVHPSLLPLYRGPAPIDRTLMAGEKITGVTIFKLNQKIDAGDIILQKKTKISDKEDCFTLQKKLANLGAQALIESLDKINKGSLSLIKQNEKNVTFANKLAKKDGKIDWSQPAKKIQNLIKATLGWPGAYTFYQNKTIKIIKSEALPEETNAPPAQIVAIDKKGIYVSTGEGTLKITHLKPEGKKEMSTWAFVCGYKIKETESFDTK